MPVIKNKFIIANDTTIVFEIHPFEMDLIKSLRTKFRFGEITIVMKDGLPIRWKRITEFDSPGQEIKSDIM